MQNYAKGPPSALKSDARGTECPYVTGWEGQHVGFRPLDPIVTTVNITSRGSVHLEASIRTSGLEMREKIASLGALHSAAARHANPVLTAFSDQR